MKIEEFCSEIINDSYCSGVCTDWEKPRKLMIGCVKEEILTRHLHNRSYVLFFLLCSASSLLSSVFVPPNKPMFAFLCSANHTSCSVRHAALWLILSNDISRRVQFVGLLDCTFYPLLLVLSVLHIKFPYSTFGLHYLQAVFFFSFWETNFIPVWSGKL